MIVEGLAALCYASRRVRSPKSPAAPVVLSLVLGLTLLAKALVPAGWMPALDDGRLRLVPCPQQGTVSPAVAPPDRHRSDAAQRRHHGSGDAHAAHVGHGGGKGRDQGGHDPHQPCTFAGNGLAWLPGFSAPDTRHLADPAAAARPFPAAFAIGRGLAAPPPPSHAPPPGRA